MSQEYRGDNGNRSCKNCGEWIGNRKKGTNFCSRVCGDKWRRYNSKITKQQVEEQHKSFNWETVEARVEAGESFRHVVYDMGAYRPASAYNYWKRNRDGVVGRNGNTKISQQQFLDAVKIVKSGKTCADAARELDISYDALLKRMKSANVKLKHYVAPKSPNRSDADRAMKRTREQARKSGIKRMKKSEGNVLGRMERTMRNHREDQNAAHFLDQVIDDITGSALKNLQWPKRGGDVPDNLNESREAWLQMISE